LTDGLKLDYSAFLKTANALATLPAKIEKDIDLVLKAGAGSIASSAKVNAPKDLGHLTSEISPVKRGSMDYLVSVNTPYAAFVEFGTGRYAARQVATLPANWQAYAAQFRGQKGNGTLDLFLDAMIEWVKRKGLIGLTRSGNRRTGKKADSDAYNLAYVIVINILRNGVHAHPYLYPAFVEKDKTIKAQLLKVIQQDLKG